MTPSLNVDDFASRIKAKYPEYSDLDNKDLTTRILSKYPEYIQHVDTTPLKNFQPSLPKPDVKMEGSVGPQGQESIPMPVNPLTAAIPGAALMSLIPGLRKYFGGDVSSRPGHTIQPSDLFRGTIGNKVTPTLTIAGGAGGGYYGGIPGGLTGGTIGNYLGQQLEKANPDLFSDDPNPKDPSALRALIQSGIQEGVGQGANLISKLGGSGGLKLNLIRALVKNKQLLPEITDALKANPDTPVSVGQALNNPLAQKFEQIFAPKKMADLAKIQHDTARADVESVLNAPKSMQGSAPLFVAGTKMEPAVYDATQKDITSSPFKMKEFLDQTGNRPLTSEMSLRNIYDRGFDQATKTFNPDNAIRELEDNIETYKLGVPSQTLSNTRQALRLMQAQKMAAPSPFMAFAVMAREGGLAITVPAAIIHGSTGGLVSAGAHVGVILTARSFAKSMANPQTARAIIEGMKMPVSAATGSLPATTAKIIFQGLKGSILQTEDGKQVQVNSSGKLEPIGQ